MSNKILHITFSDKAGGAAIAAFRHNEALNRLGYDSKMLVINKTSGSSKVCQPAGKASVVKFKAQANGFISRETIRKYHPYATFSYEALGLDIASEPIVKEADILVLHWINAGMLSIRGIEAILKLRKPTYWLLHDMWPITGGCHYSLGCERYEHHCGKCPMLFNRKGSEKEKDLTFSQLGKKIRAWSEYNNLKILAPSKWLADSATRSAVFKDHSVIVFRNVIDTDVYKPIDKKIAREVLDLPRDKKLILFGADSIKSPYKGWSYLKDALNNINCEEVECVVFGSAERTTYTLDSGVKVHSVGRLVDDYSLVLLYNSSDVFVTPSIADNYPNVILEAMACGLPCVGFNCGGIPEQIQHHKTGYISKEISPEGLLMGINWILNEAQISQLSDNARHWILEVSSYQSLERNLEYIQKNDV